MLQLGNNTASNRAKLDSVRFPETILIEFGSGGAADDAISECFEP